jgi:hypothetical protein
MKDEGGKAHGHLKSHTVAPSDIAGLHIILPLVLLVSDKAPLSKVYRFEVGITLDRCEPFPDPIDPQVGSKPACNGSFRGPARGEAIGLSVTRRCSQTRLSIHR